MRPLVKLIPYNLFLKGNISTFQELRKIQRTLIPSQKLIGIQSQKMSLEQLRQICSKLKIKNPVIGINQQFQYKNKDFCIQFITLNDLKLVETIIPIFSENKLTNQQQHQFFQQISHKINLKAIKKICENTILPQYIQQQQILNSTKIQFVCPFISLPEYFDTRFQNQIQISFYIPSNNISSENICNVLLFQLKVALKIMFQTKILYRKVTQLGNLLVQDYCQINQLERNKTIEDKFITVKSNNKNISLLFLSLFIFYFIYKTMI